MLVAELAAIAVVAPQDKGLVREGQQTLAGKALAFTLMLGLCGAVLGLVIPFGAGLLAAQRGDINGPHPAGTMPAGQALLLLRCASLGLSRTRCALTRDPSRS